MVVQTGDEELDTNSSSYEEVLDVDTGVMNIIPGDRDLNSRASVTTMIHVDNPFEKRVGKTLLWTGVNMTLRNNSSSSNNKKNKNAQQGGHRAKKLLDNVWGEVPAGETTAIMGPSGAGKSSLLHVLAGRTTTRGNITVRADVRVNNFVVDPTNMQVRRSMAFVAQDDALQVTATPREAIRFSAKLRLPRSTTESQLQILTERIIQELGLTDCADTMIGGDLIKGISGGERKRTGVGVELVTKPVLVFLDEPTSGLDSFSAVQVCEVLKKVANAGASVLFTIHQPSSGIFASFDRLILLNKGRVMYQGSVHQVPSFFRDRGHPCPERYNPADWMMKIAQSVPVATLEREGFFPTDSRDVRNPLQLNDTRHDALGRTLLRRSESRSRSSSTAESEVKPPPGFVTQVGLLVAREIKNFHRDVTTLIIRFGNTACLSFLVGIIFWNVGESDPAVPSNVQSQFGALFMILTLSLFMPAEPQLLAFPAERSVFLREYSTNHYSVSAYFISKFTVEAIVTAAMILVQSIITYFMIGFTTNFGIFFAANYGLALASTATAVLLGSAVEDPRVAFDMLSIVFVPQMLFASFFVSADLIPVWLQWAQYVCSLTYGTRIVLIATFDNCGGLVGGKSTDAAAAASAALANANCNALIDNAGADPDDVWWYWLVMMSLFFMLRLMALVILRQKATKFY